MNEALISATASLVAMTRRVAELETEVGQLTEDVSVRNDALLLKDRRIGELEAEVARLRAALELYAC